MVQAILVESRDVVLLGLCKTHLTWTSNAFFFFPSHYFVLLCCALSSAITATTPCSFLRAHSPSPPARHHQADPRGVLQATTSSPHPDGALNRPLPPPPFFCPPHRRASLPFLSLHVQQPHGRSACCFAHPHRKRQSSPKPTPPTRGSAHSSTQSSAQAAATPASTSAPPPAAATQERFVGQPQQRIRVHEPACIVVVHVQQEQPDCRS